MAMVDETARILAEHGTPSQRCEHALAEADRIKREAYTAARAAYDADAHTAHALRMFTAAYETAHAAWTAQVADAVAGCAGEIAAACEAPGPAPAVPYHQGWLQGADLVRSGLSRPDGYTDAQWSAYLAGYADGARHHAMQTERAAESARADAARVLA